MHRPGHIWRSHQKLVRVLGKCSRVIDGCLAESVYTAICCTQGMWAHTEWPCPSATICSTVQELLPCLRISMVHKLQLFIEVPTDMCRFKIS